LVERQNEAAAGPEVTETYVDFFTAAIRNRNTRAAYARACWQFFDWCAAHGLELTTVRPFRVAAWIEDFPGSKSTIKLKLAAVRMLYDFLVVRQITPSNPAHSVRGPKYVVKKGKTPVWSREDAKNCWIQSQRIRWPAYGTWRLSPRCSTASPV
jgi:integrase/recombinase XerD